MHSKSAKAPYICQQCGLTFLTWPSFIKAGRKFCSRACKHSAPHPHQPLADRFWPKVDTSSDCWRWMGALLPSGYGYIGRKDGTSLAHRVAFELTHGSIPDGMLVCHRCDNRACVNPAHLFLGTPADNSIDMVTKRRSTEGEHNPSARITRQIAVEIRELRAQGLTQSAIAARYGIGQSQVHRIIHMQHWKDTN